MKTLLFATFGFTAFFNPAPAGMPLAFDVASVKPSASQVGSGLKTDPGRLAATNLSLSELIQQAYGVSNLRIAGVPTQLGRFDIEGKTTEPHTRGELLQMLQTLLADRFKLTLHRELEEVPIGALIVAKGGPNLQPATNDSDPGILLRPGRSGEKVASVLVAGQNVTLPFVAEHLSDRLRQVIVDRTGLDGNFDFNVELAVDRGEFTDPSVSEQDNITHLFIDLIEKLGLKLELQKGLVEILVVDHAEKPDEN